MGAAGSVPGVRTFVAVLAAVWVASVSGGRPGSAVQPTPDFNQARLLERMRAKLAYPQTPLEQYEYRQRITQREHDWRGREKPATVELYHVLPNFRNPDGYRRLTERDGRPLPPDEAARLEARQQQKAAEAIGRRANETPAERETRLAREARKREEERAAIDDIFRVHAFEVEGRDLLAGRPTALVTFTPRPGVRPMTDLGQMLPKVAGRFWVDEQDAEVARVEVRSIQTITYGLGILARVRPGATMVYERTRSDTGEWMPAWYHLVADVRLMLVKPLHVDRRVEFFDFRPVVLPG